MKQHKVICFLSVGLLAASVPAAPNASFTPKETIVQEDVRALLNARPVTTLTAGKLVTWTKGVDGGGKGNGYLTMAAAQAVGTRTPRPCPIIR